MWLRGRCFRVGEGIGPPQVGQVQVLSGARRHLCHREHRSSQQCGLGPWQQGDKSVQHGLRQRAKAQRRISLDKQGQLTFVGNVDGTSGDRVHARTDSTATPHVAVGRARRQAIRRSVRPGPSRLRGSLFAGGLRDGRGAQRSHRTLHHESDRRQVPHHGPALHPRGIAVPRERRDEARTLRRSEGAGHAP